MNVSDRGLAFIANEEGRVVRDGRHVLYNDPVGHCTIGYGHLVHFGNCDGSEPEEFRRGLTEEEALALKRQDAERFVRAVNQAVTVPVTQSQFDAMVSLAFNIGEGAFASSSVARRLNAGDVAGAAEAFMMWTKADGRVLPGLVARRERERAMFLEESPASPVEQEEDDMATFVDTPARQRGSETAYDVNFMEPSNNDPWGIKAAVVRSVVLVALERFGPPANVEVEINGQKRKEKVAWEGPAGFEVQGNPQNVHVISLDGKTPLHVIGRTWLFRARG